MVRGIDKSNIFRDNEDKAHFLERLGKNVKEGQCSVYAWVFMSNHVHILFRSGKDGISTVMRKLLTGYAQYFNRKHGRSGHLFENRFKSILCDEDNYLLALIRYIHLNPVRANIVTTIEQLDRYPWSGHRTLIGKTKLPWMDTDHVLTEFGSTRGRAASEYRRFMREGLGQGRIPELTGGGLTRSKGGWSQVLSARQSGHREEYDERILGTGDFVQAILKEAEEKTTRQLKLRRSGKTFAGIIDEECRKGSISQEELKGGGRRRKISIIRATIAKRGLEELGLSLAEIARHVGVNTSSIRKAVLRLE
ncbi:MAG TPA: transposase [Nitrospirota bacterium]|nr:transposase [Nitrospirota bacterium]